MGQAETAGTSRADYHDIYEIKNIAPGLISSRINFKGNIGAGGFLTLPSSCTGTGPQTTTTLHFESTEGESASTGYSDPWAPKDAKANSVFDSVPFAPAFALSPEESQSDQPDGITTELTLPHDPSPSGIDSSQLKTASITLPEGMTLNPSAAHGLEACTPAQARIHSLTPGVACPGASKIGTVTLNVPGLPATEPLEGNIYLGGPESGPITGPPYTIYIDAESKRYGVYVRLKGSVTPNEATGRLTATFAENPEQPFSNVKLKFNGGPLAPIANPLVCGTATATTSLSPYTGTSAQSLRSVHEQQRHGCACAPLPFALSQSTKTSPRAKPERKPPTRSTSSGRTASSTSRRSRPCCRPASSG